MRDASEKQRLRRRKRLTEDQVVLIRRLHVPRVVTADMISRMLQLPFPTVDHVVRGITFKSLRPESGAPDTENAGGHEQV